MHISERFEQLLDLYRRPDGSRWGGQALQDATDGLVTRSYATNLSKGRIESPGYDKLAALAAAMGFPPALWFEDDLVSNATSAVGGVSYLDADLIGALGDRTVREAAREISRLSGRDRKVVLRIVQQFGKPATE